MRWTRDPTKHLGLDTVTILRMPLSCPRCSCPVRSSATFCHNCGEALEAIDAPESNGHANGDGSYMEIGGAGRRSRIIGGIAYVLLFAAVCTILVMLFVRFTGSMRLAIVLVLFMVSYMILMGWWASRSETR